MPPYDLLYLTILIFAASVLYSAVGQAGASGYLAVMAFIGVSPSAMKPKALVLNILVASITTFRFTGAGYFKWSILWPFTLGSILLAFFGGMIHLPGGVYKPLVGNLLLIAALPHSSYQRVDRKEEKQQTGPRSSSPLLSVEGSVFSPV